MFCCADPDSFILILEETRIKASVIDTCYEPSSSDMKSTRIHIQRGRSNDSSLTKSRLLGQLTTEDAFAVLGYPTGQRSVKRLSTENFIILRSRAEQLI